jgi:predicted kinase
VTVIWTGERGRQQGRLVAGIYRAAAGVPCERSAVIAGGLPGADKDEALAGSGVDRSRYLTVSIDAVLDQMAGAGLIPAADGLSPLMQAGQVHAEAQHLAKRVLLRALTDGRNVVLDISLASWRAAEAWTYALRFADYTLTAVFADIGVDEAVRRAGEACRRGEEEFRRGHGHGGRVIPPAAIRALASPIAAAAGNRIRWAVGARSAGAIGGTIGTGAFPGSAVIAMLVSYREGLLSLDDLSLEFRARRWPQVPDVCPPELEPAREAIDDPEPYVPGSVDDVVLAYDLGWLSDDDYDILATAAEGQPAT